ncbi:MAG: NADH:flavin oxidoreductase [Planctomycetes bacterium]|nr:NADH:flavin oxidoreductase [Planctomycetota bacterium]
MPYRRVASLKSVDEFRAYLAEISVDLPLEDRILTAPESPLAQSLQVGSFTIGNRFCVQPMEGWDGTEDGRPTEHVLRRWRRFGESGAKLIWGGEAFAVRIDARANPNQLYIGEETAGDIAALRDALLDAHARHFGKTDDLLIGLQLTHSGRFCKPCEKTRFEPRIAYHHPILDRKFNVPADTPLLSDNEIRAIIRCYHKAARLAADAGFHFVDIKHCHGYLGHELLSARSRPGEFGGSFENRTRFLREIVEGIRAEIPGLLLGVRLSAFDFVPFRPDPARTTEKRPGPGIPEPFGDLLPYRCGFGTDPADPTRYDLTETFEFLDLLRRLDIRLVNLSAGSPYYNPHIQRPALFPPSDGYQPPEDPLAGVARQIHVCSLVKQKFPDLVIVGSGYSYLQEFLPHVGQHAVRHGRVDSIGIGRMVLAYPDLPHDVLSRGVLDHQRLCRTFSDCTTAPRNGIISGCFPLDDYYRGLPEAVRLKQIKRGKGS